MTKPSPRILHQIQILIVANKTQSTKEKKTQPLVKSKWCCIVKHTREKNEE